MAGVTVHRRLVRMEFLLVLTMTADTPTHIHLDRLEDDVHTADIAMTGRASDPRADVGRMDKMDIIWLLIDTHPGY